MSDSDSDRDILIDLRSKVTDIHFNMTQPGGRVPKVEAQVEKHSAQLNQIFGGMTTAKWIIGGICGVVLALGVAFVTHLLGGK